MFNRITFSHACLLTIISLSDLWFTHFYWYVIGLRAAEQVLSGYCPQKALEDKQRRQEEKKKAKKVKKEKEEKGSIKQQTDDTENDEL